MSLRTRWLECRPSLLEEKEQLLSRGVRIGIDIVIIPISKSCSFLDVHSVQLESEWDGEEDKYLSVTLD